MRFGRPLSFAALAAAALAPLVPAQAAQAAGPSARELAALCDGCRIVTGVTTEKRKGKASGVGAAGGAVAGGVVGNRVGDSAAATVGGAVVGGLIGNEIEKRTKRHTVWVVSSVGRDGTTQKTELDADPQFRTGDIVVADGAGLRKR